MKAIKINKIFDRLNKKESTLKESEERYKNLFNKSNDIIVVFDRKTNFLDFNDALCKVLGYSRKKLSRMNVRDILPPQRRKEFPSDFKKIWDRNEFKWIGKGVRPDGKVVTMDFHSVKARFKGQDAVFSIGRDITEMEKINETLKIKDAAIASSITPIGLTDMTGKLIYGNRALRRTWGFVSEKEMLGVHSADFWQNKKEILGVVRGPLRKWGSWTGEMTAKRKDGTLFPVQVSMSIIKDNNGAPIVIMGSFMDITEKKKAEEILKRDKKMFERQVKNRTRQLVKAQEELARSNRLAEMGRMASTIAHELRNPLGVMQLALYNIMNKKPSSKILKHTAILEKKIVESENIVGRLLDYANIRNTKHSLFDIISIANEAVSSTKERFKGSKITVIKHYQDSGRILIDGNQTQIREVFENILNNAFQAINNSKGRIDMFLNKNEKELHISVKDNGIGIKRSDMSRIFDPFFTSKPKGIGLGLPICSELIKLHHGRIKIKSRKNIGTEVNISIPVRSAKVE